jgi:hypothetical protein
MRSEQISGKLGTDVNKTFVPDDGLAAITCPECGITRKVPVGDYCGKRNSIRVRCRCKQTFNVDLEFRQFHRKPTDLYGFYEVISANSGGRAAIKDLSRKGMGFMVSGVHNVRVGQNILVNFALDDKHNTPLKKAAVVRSVEQNRIGCEFKKDQAFEKDLGFYLRT